MPISEKNTGKKVAAIVVTVAAVSALHFATVTEGTTAHIVHVFFRKLYYIPIVAGALWFEFRGALGVAGAAIAVYSVHLLKDWNIVRTETVNQLGEMGSFVLLALVAGSLVRLERRARLRLEDLRKNSERKRITTAVAALSQTLAARDAETREHSRRVAELAHRFAESLALTAQQSHDIYLAGLLHDIGKIGIRDDILLKRDVLTDDEYRIVQRHPTIAEEILGPVGFEEVVRAVASHHEHPDGTGYPQGLRGDEIPLLARVLAIADTYDALRSSRPYKDPFTEQHVRRIMNEMAGTQLDDSLLEKFWTLIDRPPAQRGVEATTKERSRKHG